MGKRSKYKCTEKADPPNSMHSLTPSCLYMCAYSMYIYKNICTYTLYMCYSYYYLATNLYIYAKYICIYSKYVYVCICRKFKSLITFYPITLLFGFYYAYTIRIYIHLLFGFNYIYSKYTHNNLFMLRCSDKN